MNEVDLGIKLSMFCQLNFSLPYMHIHNRQLIPNELFYNCN